jgi:hypothetical protein
MDLPLHAFGELLQQKDARGNQTDLSYDGWGDCCARPSPSARIRISIRPSAIAMTVRPMASATLSTLAAHRVTELRQFSNGEYAEEQSYDAGHGRAISPLDQSEPLRDQQPV